MKIGIITIFNVPNYGAMLQCWSLCTAIKKMGHEPVLFHIPVKKGRKSFWHKIKNKLQFKFNHNFVKKYLPFTNDLEAEVDAYLVGSDQVWNPTIVGDQLDKFLGCFAKKGKPIASFASSFGLSKWQNEENIELIREYLSKFKIITVRERSGVELLKTSFNLDSEEVLDPCFLIDDYSELLSTDEKPSDVVFFKLLPWKDQLIKEVEKKAKDQGLSFFSISLHLIFPFLRRSIKGYNETYYSVGKWLRKISTAKYVITDSFHGMVFSLIFKRQFIVVNTKPQAITRMESLLSKLDLKHRIVENADAAFRILTNESIDYSAVGSKLRILKNQSQDKLNEIIDHLSPNNYYTGCKNY